jgi:hypothetical protein
MFETTKMYPRRMFDRWLAARDAQAVRRAWTELSPRSHALAPPGRTFTLHGAALLAGAMLGERADWIVDVLGRQPDAQTSGAVDACFLENAWDVNQPAHASWSIHEQRDGSRGVQVVIVGVGSLYGQPDGSSETVVRIFDRDRAVSVCIGSNRVATIGDVDIAPLDLLWFSESHAMDSAGLVAHLLAELHYESLPWGHLLEAGARSIYGRLPNAAIDRVIAFLRAGVEPPRDPARFEVPPTPPASAEKVWEWDISETFNPHYDATASPHGLSYGCEIQGPFCGYDRLGAQSWEEFLTVGPPARIRMPASIAAEIRAYALTRRPAQE